MLFEWYHMTDFIGQHIKRKTAKQLEPVFRIGGRFLHIERSVVKKGRGDQGASEWTQSHEP